MKAITYFAGQICPVFSDPSCENPLDMPFELEGDIYLIQNPDKVEIYDEKDKIYTWSYPVV